MRTNQVNVYMKDDVLSGEKVCKYISFANDANRTAVSISHRCDINIYIGWPSLRYLDGIVGPKVLQFHS